MSKGFIEVAPGVYVDPSLRAQLAEGEWQLLDAKGLENIGLTPSQMHTIARLAEAAFVKVAKITPRLMMLNMPSWKAHLQRTAEDPWYWDGGRNIDRYRGTY